MRCCLFLYSVCQALWPIKHFLMWLSQLKFRHQREIAVGVTAAIVCLQVNVCGRPHIMQLITVVSFTTVIRIVFHFFHDVS